MILKILEFIRHILRKCDIELNNIIHSVYTVVVVLDTSLETVQLKGRLWHIETSSVQLKAIILYI